MSELLNSSENKKQTTKEIAKLAAWVLALAAVSYHSGIFGSAENNSKMPIINTENEILSEDFEDSPAVMSQSEKAILKSELSLDPITKQNIMRVALAEAVNNLDGKTKIVNGTELQKVYETSKQSIENNSDGEVKISLYQISSDGIRSEIRKDIYESMDANSDEESNKRDALTNAVGRELMNSDLLKKIDQALVDHVKSDFNGKSVAEIQASIVDDKSALEAGSDMDKVYYLNKTIAIKESLIKHQ